MFHHYVMENKPGFWSSRRCNVLEARVLSVHLRCLCWRPPTRLPQSCTVGTAEHRSVCDRIPETAHCIYWSSLYFFFFSFFHYPVMELLVRHSREEFPNSWPAGSPWAVIMGWLQLLSDIDLLPERYELIGGSAAALRKSALWRRH